MTDKPQVGASPFAAGKIPLSTSATKIMHRASAAVDHRPAAAGQAPQKGSDNSLRPPKPKYKGIYFDLDVIAAMEKAKADKGVSYSFQVNQAMREYLKI